MQNMAVNKLNMQYGVSEPHALLRLDGLGKLKISFTSLGLEPASFWLVAVP
jgi:hypothetical protein